MVGWHHRLNSHEFEQSLGDSEGQGSLVSCSPWGHKELDTVQRLNNKVRSACQLPGKPAEGQAPHCPVDENSHWPELGANTYEGRWVSSAGVDEAGTGQVGVDRGQASGHLDWPDCTASPSLHMERGDGNIFPKIVACQFIFFKFFSRLCILFYFILFFYIIIILDLGTTI